MAAGKGGGNGGNIVLLKVCPRCHQFMNYGKMYCEKCAPIVAAEREERRKQANQRYNRKRDKKYEQFYNGKRWRVTSKKFLDSHPKCVWCGDTATEVDHIEEIKTPSGWARRYDESNFRALCTVCHNKRHNRFQKRMPPGGG